MGSERLDEIRRRCEAATPGPWEAIQDWYDGPLAQVVCGTSGIVCGVSHKDRLIDEEASIATFIAHARDDIPWLLSQLASEQAAAAEAVQERDKAWIDAVLNHCGSVALEVLKAVKANIIADIEAKRKGGAS